jgi:hypothetical protein
MPAGDARPAIGGILTAEQIVATGASIAAVQQRDGAIGWPDGHIDAWNHTECAMALSVCGLRAEARAAYRWLAAAQRPDGSWPKATVAGAVTDPAGESNQAAYPAVGVWHELLVTGDDAFAAAMWPVVRRAAGFVLGLQTARGELAWQRTADGTAASYALLTGSASAYQGLRCAIALAEYLGEPQPDWELAADLLGRVVAGEPGAFADKSRFSMDWYYPVLAGPVRGAAADQRLAEGWATFVMPGLGVRCVSDEPPAASGRVVLDRLAVRQRRALPGRAQRVDRGGDDPGRRRTVRHHRRVRPVPRGGPAVLAARGEPGRLRRRPYSSLGAGSARRLSRGRAWSARVPVATRYGGPR